MLKETKSVPQISLKGFTTFLFAALLLSVNLSDEPTIVSAFSFGSVSKGYRQKRCNKRGSTLTPWIVFSTAADGTAAASADDSSSSSSSSSSSTATRKKPLSPQEILERQRALQGGSAEDDEYPKLFEDDILDNIQQMLITLEKRVQDGPGSLSILEVEEFLRMSQVVTTEMKDKERQRLVDAAVDPAETSSSIATETTVIPAPTIPSASEISPQPVEAVSPSTATSQPPSSIDEQGVGDGVENEDGPAYDPSGGQGSLAKGTRNTYVIPNMDEMSPEEYQKALQKSLFDQQVERRKKMRAGFGNRASWDYLNNLTGESGQLRADSAFED